VLSGRGSPIRFPAPLIRRAGHGRGGALSDIKATSPYARPGENGSAQEWCALTSFARGAEGREPRAAVEGPGIGQESLECRPVTTELLSAPCVILAEHTPASWQARGDRGPVPKQP
jgi:hypothetical protein